MDEPVLALAVSARDWPDRLREFLADHGGARVRLTALSLHDLEEDDHDVLVIDDISSMLSRHLVATEHAAGRMIIGVFDRSEPQGRNLLTELGVDALIGCDESAEAFVAITRSFGKHHRSDRVPQPTSAARRRAPSGVLVDVRGISGGVGVSEVSMALGQALGDAVIVELGSMPSLAQRIGLQLHPNIVTAVEVVDHADGDIRTVLQPVTGRSRALVGASEPFSAGRGAARRVIDAVRAIAPWTVVDGGSVSTAPAASDQTIFVTSATPVGVVRCVDALRQQDLADVHVVLNRAPRGGYQRSELVGALLSEIRPLSVTIVPDDPAVIAAAWNGSLVGGGQFRKAIDAVAHAVAEAHVSVDAA